MARRKTRIRAKRANITLNSAIAPLANPGTTEGGLVGGLVVDLGGEVGTILEEGTVGGIIPRGPKPPLQLLLVQSPHRRTLDNSNLTKNLEVMLTI